MSVQTTYMIQKPQPPLRNPKMSKQSPKPRSQNGKKTHKPISATTKKTTPTTHKPQVSKKKENKRLQDSEPQKWRKLTYPFED